MSKYKLITLLNVKNELWVLEKFLKRTTEFSDGIIAIDNGSSDGSYELLKSSKKVIDLIKIDGPFNELLFKNILLEKAKKYNPNWLLFIDVDELMELGFIHNLDEMLSQDDYDKFLFKEITLWKSNEFYRIDSPEKYSRIHAGSPILIRNLDKIRWKKPSKSLKKYIMNNVVKLWYPHHVGGREIIGVDESRVLTMDNIVKLHYHFANWDKCWEKHMRYAMLETQRYGRFADIDKIMEEAISRLNENGIKLKHVKNEWGVL